MPEGGITPVLSRKWLVEDKTTDWGTPDGVSVMEFKKPVGWHTVLRSIRGIPPHRSIKRFVLTPLPLDMKDLPHNIGDR